jgi:hypothetical protein
MIRLHLDVDPAGLSLFCSLLEKGVTLEARTGCTVRRFLCGQLGLATDYLDDRIQTLFLDARPVDDVDTAVVRDGSTLALSAAMPGLVGATMRKGGRYAAFRKDISQQADECGICEASGRVTVKLFNMVAKEVGGRLLAAGVEVDGSDIANLARRHADALGRSIKAARRDGHDIPADLAFFSTLSTQRVLLSVSLETCDAG